MRKWIISLALTMFLLPLPVWAAKCLVGEYMFDDEILIKTVVKDSATIRIDINAGAGDAFEIYLLAVNGKRWVAGRDNNDSNWEIIDFDLLMEQDALSNDGTLEDLSAGAKIAKPAAVALNGFKGQSFAVEYVDDYGYTEEFTLVLSENTDVVAVTRAIKVFAQDIYDEELFMMIRLMERIAQERGKEQGLLQYEDLQLKSITKAKFNNDYFTLPQDGVLTDLTDIFN